MLRFKKVTQLESGPGLGPGRVGAARITGVARLDQFSAEGRLGSGGGVCAWVWVSGWVSSARHGPAPPQHDAGEGLTGRPLKGAALHRLAIWGEAQVGPDRAG